MQVLGTILLVVGMIVLLVGGIRFLVVAFQESVGWGLGCLLVPFVSLIFLVMYWDRANRPFFVQLAGAVPLVFGSLTTGSQV
jgi:hypothetical protein